MAHSAPRLLLVMRMSVSALIGGGIPPQHPLNQRLGDSSRSPLDGRASSRVYLLSLLFPLPPLPDCC